MLENVRNSNHQTKKYVCIYVQSEPGLKFAFANITYDMRVDVENVRPSFEAFIGMTDFKRIFSFGG